MIGKARDQMRHELGMIKFREKFARVARQLAIIGLSMSSESG